MRFWTNLKGMAKQVNFILILVREWTNMGLGRATFHKGDFSKKNRAKKFKDGMIIKESWILDSYGFSTFQLSHPRWRKINNIFFSESVFIWKPTALHLLALTSELCTTWIMLCLFMLSYSKAGIFEFRTTTVFLQFNCPIHVDLR